ncbi:MAG: GntR family transcriptional regulator [Planctomycetaceae bacterium]
MRFSWLDGLREHCSTAGKAGRPKYERLRDGLVAQVESGLLAPGDALPSEQTLAEALQVARSTVRQSMASLERDGFVRRIHGKGTFVHEQARLRLRRGQDLFALIVPETQAGFYPSLQRSFEDAAAERNHQVIVCNSSNDVDRQGNAILQLIDHRVAGVAIVPTTDPPTPSFQVRQLQRHGIPVVCCSRRVEGVSTPLLAIPFEEVGRRAGEAIREAGHHRAAFFGTMRTAAAEAYERGFRSAFLKKRAKAFVTTFYGSHPSPDPSTHERRIAEALDAILESGDGPTAIFASFDSLAESIYVLLGQRGLRVPQDVALVGFGGFRRPGVLARRLTSVTVDEIRLGHEAVELLDRMSRGELPIDLDETRDMPLGLSEGLTLAHVTETSSSEGGALLHHG